MNKLQIAGLSALTLLGSMTAIQAQATTPPVGYVTLASVSNPIPANTDVRLSVPMEASVDFTGLAASFENNVLTVAGGAFAAEEFAPATGGYYLRIKNGTSAGQTAEITANTEATLTVAFETGDDFTGVDGTTQIEIVKYFTLSTFFPSDLPDATEILFFNNTTENINLAPTSIVVIYSGLWYDKSDFSVIDAVLYPGESFILRNTSSTTAITDIVITGTVPSVSHSATLNSISGNSQDYSLSYLSPVSEVIANASLGFNEADELLVFDRSSTGINKAPSLILAHYSGVWYDKSDFSDVTNSFLLEPGIGYVYRRASGSPEALKWNNVQTYNQ